MLHVSPDVIRYLQCRGYIPRQHPLTFAAPVAAFPAWVARYEALHQQAGTLSEVALGQLLGSLFTACPDDSPPITEPLRQLIQDVQDYLREARQHKLSLEALAQRFALSKYQLIRHFSRFTGVTPNKYLTILRMEQAKSLLAAGHPLVDVALEVGFYDQSHFARYFQVYSGLTPGGYQGHCNILQD
jgi:AraC-like DNA-binding protein